MFVEKSVLINMFAPSFPSWVAIIAVLPGKRWLGKSGIRFQSVSKAQYTVIRRFQKDTGGGRGSEAYKLTSESVIIDIWK